MSKKKAVLNMKGQQMLDKRLYYFTAISIFLITFFVRIKKLTFYYPNDLQHSIRTVFNTFTYFKLRGLIVLFLICLGIFIYRSVKYHIKFIFDAVTIGIILIILSSVVSTLFTDMTEVAFWGFYTRTNGLLAYISLFGLFLIISRLNISEKQLKFLVHGINILSIIVVAIGMMEFFGHSIFNMAWYRNIYIPSELRSMVQINLTTDARAAGSILGQQNYFGAFCSIIFPFITIQALAAKKLQDKILLSIGSVMLFIGAYMSISMGPWVGILIVLALIIVTFKHWKSYLHLGILILLYIFMTAIFAKYQPTIVNEMTAIMKAIFPKFNYALLFAVLIISVLLILYYKCEKINKYRFISAIIILSILVTITGFVYVLIDVVPDNMAFLSGRGYAWHYTFQMLKNNFIIGYGPDTFFYNFPQNNPDAAMFAKNHVFDKPHNMYLQMLVDNGLFGFIGFMLLLVSTLLVLMRSAYRNENSIETNYSIASFFATVAYMIQGITNDNHMVIQPILYLLIATGLAISRK